MIREFTQLVTEAVDAGTERGLSLFMESLEEDLSKGEVIEECGGIDEVITRLFESEGIIVEQSVEELDETRLDALLMGFAGSQSK
jgi:hypothetical protein